MSDFVPLTLKEALLDAAINDTEIPEIPVNAPRELKLIRELAEKIQEGGGGSSVTVEPLTVTENGVYPPESGKAFGTVTVNVPDSGDAMTDVSEVGM